jgi:hypothetical protein
MKVQFGSHWKNRNKGTATWALSVPIVDTRGFGEHVVIEATEQVLRFKFSHRPELPVGHLLRGRKLNRPKGNSNLAHVTFSDPLTPLVGIPVVSRRWDVEASQISTDPVTFEFPLPNLAMMVRSPQSAPAAPDQHRPAQTFTAGTKVENGVDNLRSAAELFNDYLRAMGSTYKAYVRPDGTVWVRHSVSSEVDI